MACRLYCLVLGHSGSQKNRVDDFFNLKNKISIFFYPKHLQNIIANLINQFMASKNLKSYFKTWNQLETKKITKIIYIFLGFFKVKKTL